MSLQKNAWFTNEATNLDFHTTLKQIMPRHAAVTSPHCDAFLAAFNAMFIHKLQKDTVFLKLLFFRSK